MSENKYALRAKQNCRPRKVGHLMRLKAGDIYHCVDEIEYNHKLTYEPHFWEKVKEEKPDPKPEKKPAKKGPAKGSKKKGGEK